jgi:hypothetical protein
MRKKYQFKELAKKTPNKKLYKKRLKITRIIFKTNEKFNKKASKKNGTQSPIE